MDLESEPMNMNKLILIIEFIKSIHRCKNSYREIDRVS
jgi:hypothetical protein